ncbi:MAG: hypothetical protein WCO91_04750 [Gemmataceae bacterium]
MAYWLREIAGWLLILAGLWLMGIVIEFCQNRWILEAAIIAVMAVFVFRGGIHLLKVAIAARICREAWVRGEAAGETPLGEVSHLLPKRTASRETIR